MNPANVPANPANVGAGDGARAVQGSGMSGLPAIQRLVGRENWPSWKFAVQMYLEHEDLWDIVKPTANEDGTFPAVDPVKDRKTKAKIALLLDPVNYVHVQESTSARDAWSKLEQAFEDSGPERKVGLLYKLINTKLVNCNSMVDYVNRIVSTSLQLRGIGFDVSEEWVGALLLAGLPPEYKPMVMAITNSGVAIKGDLIKTKLLQEVEEPSVKVALATKNQKSQSRSQPQQSKGPKCRSCQRFGHIAKNCTSKKQEDGKNDSALSTVLSTVGDAEEDAWYFDSGATSHLTKNSGALENLRSSSGMVTAANGGVMKVLATGEVKLEASCCPGKPALTVHDVQLIPELATNLLSVSQIVDKGHKVIFDKHGCKVVNSKGNVFATGTRNNNLFKFDVMKQTKAMSCRDAGKAELWHKRMGHINIQSLKKLRDGLATGVEFNDNAYEDCKVCALGKQTRLPFSKTGSRASDVLELVHSDMCGPMEVASNGGSRYYLIYMRQPPAFAVRNQERKVCRLKKGLYGLKQAARSCNIKLHTVLEKQEFKRCKADPCLYSKVTNGKRYYVLIYVDDLIVASESTEIHDALVAALEENFEISKLGDIHYYLGIEVERDQDGDFFLNQRKYIKHVIDSNGLSDAKVSKMPLDPGYLKQEGEDQLLSDNKEYQKVVGQLLYLSVNTRPDISAAISIMGRKTASLTQADWNELKRIIRYLKGTSHYRLRVSCSRDQSGLNGYADADYAQNTTDRKSNSGYLFKFNGGTISWCCRKQTSVALSTAEAEFIALAEATQEALWLKRLLAELHENTEVMIIEDNQSCLKMLDQEKFSNRTKHISTKYHFIRDVKEKKEVSYIYCPTEDMVADILTKPLNGVRTLKLAKASGLDQADRGGVLE